MIVADPAPTAVTLPSLTVATSVLLLLHVTDCPLGDTDADNVWLSPVSMDRELLESEILGAEAVIESVILEPLPLDVRSLHYS